MDWVYTFRRIETDFTHGADQSDSVSTVYGDSSHWLLHLLAGREIIREGFWVRDKILNLAPTLLSGHDVGWEYPADFIMPFYHCGLVSVSRFFIDPLWQLAGEELPLLPEETIRSHSLVALSCIEQRLGKVNLESVFYLPLLLGISLEVRSPRHRQRVMRLFRMIEDRGFAVARTFISDIQLAWSLVPS